MAGHLPARGRRGALPPGCVGKTARRTAGRVRFKWAAFTCSSCVGAHWQAGHAFQGLLLSALRPRSPAAGGSPRGMPSDAPIRVPRAARPRCRAGMDFRRVWRLGCASAAVGSTATRVMSTARACCGTPRVVRVCAVGCVSYYCIRTDPSSARPTRSRPPPAGPRRLRWWPRRLGCPNWTTSDPGLPRHLTIVSVVAPRDAGACP